MCKGLEAKENKNSGMREHSIFRLSLGTGREEEEDVRGAVIRTLNPIRTLDSN